MSRFLRRLPCLFTRTRSYLHSPVNFRHARVVAPLFDRSISRPVFFSSDSNSNSNSAPPGFNSDKVVSKEELKDRIRKILDDGNEDSIPDLFELMMIRKLSGNHDDSDNEVMEEVVRNHPLNDAHDSHSESDTETDGDGDSSDSDIESDDDDLRDGDSSDSDIQSDDDDLRDGDSSDSDIESDDDVRDVGLSDVSVKINGQKANHSSNSDSPNVIKTW